MNPTLTDQFSRAEYGVSLEDLAKNIRLDKFMFPGAYFLSAGNTHLYRVESYPCCRLYWQHKDDPDLNPSMKKYYEENGYFSEEGFALTPWTTESTWGTGFKPNKKGSDYLLKLCDLSLDQWMAIAYLFKRKANIQIFPNDPSYEAAMLIEGEPIQTLDSRLTGEHKTYKPLMTIKWEVISCQTFDTLQELQKESTRFLGSQPKRPQPIQFSSELIAAIQQKERNQPIKPSTELCTA